MSDETAPLLGDTPATESAPGEGHAQTAPEINWEQRYTDLRSEFNRRDEEIKNYRDWYDSLTDPQTQADALSQLGLALQQEPEAQQQEWVDPIEARLNPLEQQLQELLTERQQWQAQQDQQRQAEHIASNAAGQVIALEKEIGRDFSEEEQEFLLARAYQTPDESGIPDVQGAWERLKAFEETQQQQWLQTKRSRAIPGSGESAGKQPDLSTAQGRREAMIESLAALDDAVVR